METIVRKYKCFEDFLEDLKPNGFLYNAQESYIYRGQSEDFSLVPSILRQDNKALAPYTFSNGIQTDTEIGLRYAEFNLLREFYINANKSGLKVPETIFSGYDYVSNWAIVNSIQVSQNDWLPQKLVGIAALAQHYGIPTRLLDWSFDINIALYFAVKSSLKKILKNKCVCPNKNIVIWLLNFTSLNEISSYDGKFPLKFVIPNYSDNPNINAQKGLLTYWVSKKENSENRFKSTVCRTPLDQLLLELNPKDFHGNSIQTMCKLMIPYKETLKAFKYLSKNNYHGANLLPGYSGCTTKVEEDILIVQVEPLFGDTGWRPELPLISNTNEDNDKDLVAT